MFTETHQCTLSWASWVHFNAFIHYNIYIYFFGKSGSWTSNCIFYSHYFRFYFIFLTFSLIGTTGRCAFDPPKYSHKLSESVVLNCDLVRKHGSPEQAPRSNLIFVLRHQKVKRISEMSMWFKYKSVSLPNKFFNENVR